VHPEPERDDSRLLSWWLLSRLRLLSLRSDLWLTSLCAVLSMVLRALSSECESRVTEEPEGWLPVTVWLPVTGGTALP